MAAENDLKPLYDRVVIKRVEVAKVSEGGLHIPEAAIEKPIMGIVVAIGDGAFDATLVHRPMSVKVGDKVLFGKYAGVEITYENEEYLILKEEEILLIFGKDNILH